MAPGLLIKARMGHARMSKRQVTNISGTPFGKFILKFVVAGCAAGLSQHVWGPVALYFSNFHLTKYLSDKVYWNFIHFGQEFHSASSSLHPPCWAPPQALPPPPLGAPPRAEPAAAAPGPAYTYPSTGCCTATQVVHQVVRRLRPSLSPSFLIVTKSHSLPLYLLMLVLCGLQGAAGLWGLVGG